MHTVALWLKKEYNVTQSERATTADILADMQRRSNRARATRTHHRQGNLGICQWMCCEGTKLRGTKKTWESKRPKVIF